MTQAKRDIIVGCFTNYDWNKIQFWANSVDQSGFSGEKLMIVYNSTFATVQKLLDKQFNIRAFARDDAKQIFYYPHAFVVVVSRFFHLWEFFNSLPNLDEYRYVITTDVKDVVFQQDPTEWLEHNLGDKKICVSSESIQYCNEPWGNENLLNSFPAVYNHMKNNTIWNCGVLAGEVNTMKDLFLHIYLLSINNPVHNPDQAALNVLLNTEPYKSITKFALSEDGWACQAGTSNDTSKNFTPYLLEPAPLFDGEYATTSIGKKYAILHQYDRISAWKPLVENKYKDSI